jgi:hypothetical protein
MTDIGNEPPRWERRWSAEDTEGAESTEGECKKEDLSAFSVSSVSSALRVSSDVTGD